MDMTLLDRMGLDLPEAEEREIYPNQVIIPDEEEMTLLQAKKILNQRGVYWGGMCDEAIFGTAQKSFRTSPRIEEALEDSRAIRKSQRRPS
jgi:hypothetical protein